ncbi:MAG TPA: hypothetical protein VJP88_02805 [Caulobacteraceae bacterium]|nr:hypothetical protein [Caulobacteraceae bacterium]
MNFKTPTLLAAIGVALSLGAAGAASATPWQAHHPRRVEVNHRLDNQQHRIREERRLGEISPAKAARLHRADYRIRMQERRFARHHGSHLTRAERAQLNHEENRVSHRIG